MSIDVNFTKSTNNTKYDVFTPKGFQSFDGILSGKSDQSLICLELDDGNTLSCTQEHELYTKWNKRVFARNLKIGKKLKSYYGTRKIVGISEKPAATVYDLLDVKNGNNYYVTSCILSRNCIYLDEFAYVPNDVEFYTATYPVISSGDSTKVIITSTPNGLNYFYKLWKDSEVGANDYRRYHVHWSEHPKRDQKWFEETMKNTSELQFSREYLCNFLGSSDTLISGTHLQRLTFEKPIFQSIDTKIYSKPIKNNKYVTVVDSAEGVSGDYSVISVFDVTNMPFKQVFMFKKNDISPNVFSTLVYKVAMQYNESTLVIESNNSSGAIVVQDLWEMEYENILRTSIDDSENRVSGKKSKPGVRTTKKTKKIGCTKLKDLIENDKLIIVDSDTVVEMSTFIRVSDSYQAEKGKHDDIAMTLVIFAWFVSQDFFEDEVGINVSGSVKNSLMGTDSFQEIYGFISNGLENNEVNEDFGLLFGRR